jgi:hypothetical protein
MLGLVSSLLYSLGGASERRLSDPGYKTRGYHQALVVYRSRIDPYTGDKVSCETGE